MGKLMDDLVGRCSHKHVRYLYFLLKICSNSKYTEKERSELFSKWSKAPSAKKAHPREEHLIPAFVVAGAGYIEGRKFSGKKILQEWVGQGTSVANYMFE